MILVRITITFPICNILFSITTSRLVIDAEMFTFLLLPSRDVLNIFFEELLAFLIFPFKMVEMISFFYEMWMFFRKLGIVLEQWPLTMNQRNL